MSSLTDILTAVKNVVTALNSGVQNFLNVNAATVKANITSATLVKASTGRLATLSIVAGGTVSGFIYDSNSVANTTTPIYAIPTTIGLVFINLPVTNGIVVVPGAGQNVTVGFS